MKTTLLGVAIIIATVSSAIVTFLKGGMPDLQAAFVAITAGFGLITAKDAK
jgi:hypothetical protein